MVLRGNAAKGLTLVECLLAVAIVAGTMLAATYTVVAGHRHSMYGDRAARATRLARDLLEEIASRCYAEPTDPAVFGPEPGEASRSEFDDVDDYRGWSEPAGTLRDASGIRYGEEDQPFSRSVSVQRQTATLGGALAPIPGVTVTLTVRHESGEQWQFMRFIPEPSAR